MLDWSYPFHTASLCWGYMEQVWSSAIGISTYALRQVPLLEAMVVCDGAMTALAFVKQYILYKACRPQIQDREKKRKMKEAVVQRCSEVYVLGVVDRYLLYIALYSFYIAASSISSYLETSTFASRLMYVVVCSATLPAVQNAVVRNRFTDRYLVAYDQQKLIFFKYSVSKLVVNTVQRLDEGIVEIRNYHIFMLYRHITLSYLWEVLQGYCFIGLLYHLRGQERTYYYYKAIKLSYYYNCGYMFNVMSRREAVSIMNGVVLSKRWKDLTQMEIIHAVYTLASSKFNVANDKTNVLLAISKFFSIWSGVCLLKLLTPFVDGMLLVAYMSHMYLNENSSQLFLRRGLLAVAIYCLLLLNTNDLIISVIFFASDVLYYAFDEIVFFVAHVRYIGKVLNFYRKRNHGNEYSDF